MAELSSPSSLPETSVVVTPASELEDDGAAYMDVLSDTLAELAGEPFTDVFATPASSVSDMAEQYDLIDDFDFDLLDFRREPTADLKEAVKTLLRRAATPRRILLRDKIAFVVGTTDLWLTAYWLGASPETFHLFYTPKIIALLIIRIIVYRSKRWGPYLYDFCYAAQLLQLIQLYALPTSIVLAKVMFAISMGPLLWSIVAFRNSLVLHSLDKTTSHFLHWAPACVMYAQKWGPSNPALKEKLSTDPLAASEWQSASLRELALYPLIFHGIWAVAYYVKIFVVSSEKIQKKGYETLFQYVTRSRKSVFGAVVLRFPEKYQPIAYMVLHQVLTLMTMLLTSMCWKYRAANRALLVLIFVMSAWNGASFYFDVFASRYLSQLGLHQNSKGVVVSRAMTPTKKAD